MANEITGQLLGQINHLQAVLGISAPGNLKTASVVSYGPDGKTVAKQTDADYKAAVFDETGNLTGGSLQYSTHSQGKQLSQSTANFGNDGKPTTLSSTIFDRQTGEQHCGVNVDFSGLQWSQTNRIQSGELKVATTKISQSANAVSGAVAYANEQLARMNLTHYAQDESSIQGYTSVNYENVEFMADEIAGGYLLIATQRPDRTLSSQAKLSYSADGQPTVMETTGYESNGTEASSNTLTDYTLLKFDPLGHILMGDLSLTTQNKQGILQSKTIVTFANGVPQIAKTQAFSQKGTLLHQVETDYAGAQFNHHNHVINSVITVKTLRADGSLTSSAQVQYGADGKPVKHNITSYQTDGESEVSHTEVNYAAARFDQNRKVINGQVTAETTFVHEPQTILTTRHYAGMRQSLIKETVVRAADGSTQSSTKTIKRPDGTVAEVITQVNSQTANITQYATDGKTVIKFYQVDYSNAVVTSGAIVSGNVTMNILNGNQRLLGTSNLNYGDSGDAVARTAIEASLALLIGPLPFLASQSYDQAKDGLSLLQNVLIPQLNSWANQPPTVQAALNWITSVESNQNGNYAQYQPFSNDHLTGAAILQGWSVIKGWVTSPPAGTTQIEKSQIDAWLPLLNGTVAYLPTLKIRADQSGTELLTALQTYLEQTMLQAILTGKQPIGIQVGCQFLTNLKNQYAANVSSDAKNFWNGIINQLMPNACSSALFVG